MVSYLDGIMNIDFIGGFLWLAGKVPEFLLKAFNWISNALGGNMIAALLLIGFGIYIIIDIVYHKALDYPAAKAGSAMTGIGKKILFFIIIFCFVLLVSRIGY